MTNTVPALSRALVGAGARFPIDTVLRVAAESLLQPTTSTCTKLLTDAGYASAPCAQPLSAACAWPCQPGTLGHRPRTPSQPWPQTNGDARGQTSRGSICDSTDTSSSCCMHVTSNPSHSSGTYQQPTSAHDPGRQHSTHEYSHTRRLDGILHAPEPCAPGKSTGAFGSFSTGACSSTSSSSSSLSRGGGMDHRRNWVLAACNPACTQVMEHHHGAGWAVALPGWRRAVSSSSGSSSGGSAAKADRVSAGSQGDGAAGSRRAGGAARPPAEPAAAEAVPGLPGASPEEEISFVQVRCIRG